MLVDFESVWFKSYSKAVLESEPEAVRASIKKALEKINERLLVPDLSPHEREAIKSAERYLRVMGKTDLRKAS
jgi:hypothetical protein